MRGYHGTDAARWQVIWYVPAKKQFVRKDFEDDLASALQLYLKAKTAEKPFATLRCCNFGFAPPRDLRPREVVVTENRRKVRKLYVPLKAKNRAGIFWCPYCRELRRFVKKKRIVTPSGNEINEPRFCCPVCYVGHTDHNVRKYNPLIIRIAFEIDAENTRAPRRTATSRRQARRRKQRAAS